MTASYYTDNEGAHWPITGYWCNTCGRPMHAVNVPYGTHPTCDPTYQGDN